MRHRDLGQGRAAVKGSCPNLGEGGRQRDLGQGRAELEGAFVERGEGSVTSVKDVR